jgi:hypothetical protein
MELPDLGPHKFMKERLYRETPITFAFQHLKQTKEALSSASTVTHQQRIQELIAVALPFYATKTLLV